MVVRRPRYCLLAVAAVMFATTGLWCAAQDVYETPPTLHAGNVLPPDVISGSEYSLSMDVICDGQFRAYRVQSDFGDFDAGSNAALERRIAEVEAIAFLHGLESHEAVGRGAREGIIDVLLGPWNFLKRVFRNPLYVLEGIPGEILRLFGLIDGARTLFTEGPKPLIYDALGVDGARRALAQRAGADRHSPNAVYQEAIKEDAWFYALGHGPIQIGAERYMPEIPMTIQIGREGTGNIGEAANFIYKEVTPSSERKRLRRLDVPRELRNRFRENTDWTRSDRGPMVTALYEMRGVENRVACIEAAVELGAEAETIAYAQQIHMASEQHQDTPFARAVVADQTPIFIDENDAAWVFISGDDWYWTAGQHHLLDAAADAIAAANATAGSIVVRGETSETWRQAWTAGGWTVRPYAEAATEAPDEE